MTREEYEEIYGIEKYDDNECYIPRCETCGAKLNKYLERREFWGFPCDEEFWECPNCDR